MSVFVSTFPKLVSGGRTWLCISGSSKESSVSLSQTGDLRPRNLWWPEHKFIKIHIHQKPLSSKNHFHQKTTFIKNHFHQRPVSSKTTFIKNQFHQKPFSSEKMKRKGGTVNIVRVCVKRRRPKAGDAPHEGLLEVERRGFRSLGFRSLGFRSLGFRSLGFRSLGFRV